MKKSDRKRNREGMTLVETLVALGLFAMFVAGMAGIVVMSRQVTDQARSHYQAINIAKNRLETTRTFGFDEVGLFEEDEVRIDVDGSPDSDGRFRRTTVISNITPQLVQVMISVEMLDRISLEFEGEEEVLRSRIADYMELPE